MIPELAAKPKSSQTLTAMTGISQHTSECPFFSQHSTTWQQWQK